MRRTFALLVLCLAGCAPSIPNYDGPLMKQKDITETFKPILDFMEYKPGMAFADVGAGNGGLTIMMATLMDSSYVYLQEIDTSALQASRMNSVIDYYSKKTGTSLRTRNRFEIAIGTPFRTNLPDSTFDLIYSNGTVHNFASLDSIAVDLKKKLKSGGVIYLRDSFKKDDLTVCPLPSCARPLLSVEECIMVMARNGFVVVKHAPDMSGHPVFAFAVAE